jgi:hypothetical protein
LRGSAPPYETILTSVQKSLGRREKGGKNVANNPSGTNSENSAKIATQRVRAREEKIATKAKTDTGSKPYKVPAPQDVGHHGRTPEATGAYKERTSFNAVEGKTDEGS